MNVQWPPIRELVHRFIIGALAGALICALWWLVTGALPSILVVWLGVPAVILAVSHMHKRRQQREAQKLADLFDSPAFGEGDDDVPRETKEN